MSNEVIQSEALQVAVPQEAGFLQLRPPEAVLADAKRACVALMACIDAKPDKDKVFINGELFLEQDDWALVSRFFQTAPRIRETRFCEYGNAIGFEAYADLIDVRSGAVLCSADMMCLNDEDNWGERTEYEWQDVLDKDGNKIWVDKTINGEKKKLPKREKVEAGSKPTPLFQLRSMAQTRAAAKVARLMYSWVVALSGRKISSTPAEEMRNAQGNYGPNIEQDSKSTSPREPISSPEKTTAKAVPISEGQVKRMFAIGKQAGMSEDGIKATYQHYGFNHAENVTRDKYDEIVELLKKGKEPTGEPTKEAKPKAAAKGASSIEGPVSEVSQGNNKGPFILLKMVGFDLYSREERFFETLLGAKGKHCKFMMVQASDGTAKGKIVSILKIGSQEWLEDGTPVRHIDREQQEIPPEFE